MKTRKQLVEELCPYKNLKWHDEPCKRCKAIEEILDEHDKNLTVKLADRIVSAIAEVSVSATVVDWLVGLVFGPASFANQCVKKVADKVIDTLTEK